MQIKLFTIRNLEYSNFSCYINLVNDLERRHKAIWHNHINMVKIVYWENNIWHNRCTCMIDHADMMWTLDQSNKVDECINTHGFLIIFLHTTMQVAIVKKICHSMLNTQIGNIHAWVLTDII